MTVRHAPGIAAVLLCAAIIAGFCWVQDYYHATDEARAALQSDSAVIVERTSYGWFFDGPASGAALIFYPGAKVEETAYAPFLHLLAAQGLDVCLVKMPARLALLGSSRAARARALHSCSDWYIGGHSLGGAMAASYAARHALQFKGLVLCAAYPAAALDADMKLVVLYGSEDTVLNMENFAKGMCHAPAGTMQHVIAGGNHAQFGDYGVQHGDGKPLLPARSQQEEACRFIMASLFSERRTENP